ncbi:MAG TPA: diguanylate cyclase [Anaerolineaceae bacterium]|nr:diguanylate cyclase [Anaerolineaceae bacterium]HPN52584.1 diguanylate cyclase [Anaerolineaceae bacterium]
MMALNFISIFALFCGLISFSVAVYAWQKRSTLGTRSFALLMFFMTIYILGYSMELASLNVDTMLFWSKIQYIGIVSFPCFFLIFAMRYTGHDYWVTTRNRLLIFFLPAVLLGIKFLDDSLHLIYVSVTIDTSGLIPLLSITRGPLYYIVVGYNLLVVTIANGLLIQKRRYASELYRKQTRIILEMAAIIYLIYLFYLTGVPLFPSLKELDLNPFVYLLWGCGTGYAIFRYRLFDLAPIARDALIEKLGDGVVVLDLQARVMDANPEALKIFNWIETPLGQRIETLLPQWTGLDMLNQMADSAKDEQSLEKNGNAFHYEVSISTINNKKGLKLGWLLVAHDITLRKNFEKGLRESEEKFHRMTDTTATGIYIYSGKSLAVINPAFQKITGYSEDDLVDMDPMNIFHPDFREMVRQRTVARLQGKEVPSRYEAKIITREGIEKWVDLSATTITYQGQPATLGTFLDITEQKKLEDHLRASQKLYLGIVENQTDPICRWLPDTTLTFVNRAYCEYFNLSLDHVLGTRFLPTLPEETQVIIQDAIHTLMNHEAETISKEEVNIGPNGEKRWMVWAYLPIEDADGKIVEFQSVGRDVTLRKQAEQALQRANDELEKRLEEIQSLQERLLEQAIHDVLTGLFNRRYLEESLEREIASAERGHYPIGIIMLDLDHFKKVNDTYGHKGGDLVLQAVGKVLREATRRMDTACRLGGEEFVVVMPGATLEDTFQRAENLRQKIEALQVDYNGKNMRVTTSIGVSAYPEYGQTMDELLHRADEALYMAKNSGRNMVCAYNNGQQD